ncbi:MAG TPA: DUF6776 family protein [Gammaproteobacteria bacterium]|nr:DUF6776 family protein [Gammaproteobacteria bacterium]
MNPLRGRPRAISVLIVVLIAAGGYLIFELGRYQAGYSLLDHERDLDRLRKLTAAQKADLEDAERQIAILKTSREVDQETYAQVKASLDELETKLQAQEEELEFYRGIVSPASGEAGLRVQNLQVKPGGTERRYVLELVLMQSIANTRRVEGTVKLKVTGTQEGASAELALADIAVPERTSQLTYQFKYFQTLQQELELPKGFEPATVEIELSPSAPKARPTTQVFQWSAIAAE